MTPQEARDAAQVMIAFAEGKKIERRLKGFNRWEQAPEPMWAWGYWEYRVAAEPWQGKIWVHPDGTIQRAFDGHSVQSWEALGYRLITAKEVADE